MRFIDYTCDRCGKQYKLNTAYQYKNPNSSDNKTGYLTGVTLTVNRRHFQRGIDLCDNCLSDFLTWVGIEKRELKQLGYTLMEEKYES